MWMAILKPQINGKSPKTQKDDNLLKTKRILKAKYKPSGGLVFTFSWPGESYRPSSFSVIQLQETL